MLSLANQFQSHPALEQACSPNLDKSLFQSLSFQLLAYSTSTNLHFALIVKDFKVEKLGALSQFLHPSKSLHIPIPLNFSREALFSDASIWEGGC